MDIVDKIGGAGIDFWNKAHFGMSASGYSAQKQHEWRMDHMNSTSDPTEGPEVESSLDQTSTYGESIPRLYGRIKLGGNIFWLKNNKIDVRKRIEITESEGGGS